MNLSGAFLGLLTNLSHFSLLALVSIIGFVFISRKAFGSTIFVTVFTMALNAYLKSIWQVPLNPELNKEGWSFPSGHTQSSCVFWFFLSLMLGNRVFIICTPIVLFGVLYGIVHFGYHEWYEVLAGIGFAGLEIIFFYYLLRIFKFYKIEYYSLGFILTFAILVFLFFILPPSKQGYFWIWNGLGGVLGLSIGWILSEKLFGEYQIKHKLAIFGVLIALFIGGYFGLHYDKTKILYNSIVVFMIGLFVSLGLVMIDRKLSRYF